MADNYLEYRQQEIAESRPKVVRKGAPSLDTLLHRNRSYRGYDSAREVTERRLGKSVNAHERIFPVEGAQQLPLFLQREQRDMRTAKLPRCPHPYQRRYQDAKVG